MLKWGMNTTPHASSPGNAPLPKEASPNPQSSLLEMHRGNDATGTELITYGDVEIVSTYGVPQAEYAAIRKASGLMDLAQRGVLEVGGKDRASFLNNFLTNLTWSKDTKLPMAEGTGVYSFLLNGKGRVIADMNVLETGESIYLETDARLVPFLRTSLGKYVFTEKVTFTDRRGEWCVLAVHGPLGLGVLQEAGAVMGELGVLGSKRVKVGGKEVLVFRDDVCGVPGYFLVVGRGDVGEVWKALAAPYEGQTNKRTLRPVGWAMFNATRIEAGRPMYGIDFSDQSLPAETGAFGRAVSVVKGCYLGQEIVARMYARNVVAKELVGVRMLADALPTAGAEVLDGGGTNVGVVTSSTLSPVMGRAAVALATVKKGFTAVGTKLRIPAESAMREAEVVGLPFVGGEEGV